MDIGEVVTHGRRKYRVRGFDPLGVMPQHLYLEDILNGQHLVLTVEELHKRPAPARAHLRLVERNSDVSESE